MNGICFDPFKDIDLLLLKHSIQLLICFKAEKAQNKYCNDQFLYSASNAFTLCDINDLASTNKKKDNNQSFFIKVQKHLKTLKQLH